MKVKLLVSRSGPDGAQNAGDEIDVSGEEAKRMVGAGQAELIRSKKVEKAVASPKVEKAAD